MAGLHRCILVHEDARAAPIMPSRWQESSCNTCELLDDAESSMLWPCSEARVGGMLGGKAGLVHVHMGTGEAQLQPLYDALEASDVPITQFLPTHMERNPSLVNEAKRWIDHGGFVDFTAGTKVWADISLSWYP